MIKRWKRLEADQEKINILHEVLKINSTICKILVQREIDDFEKSKAYIIDK